MSARPDLCGRCEAALLADLAHIDQLAAEAADEQTSPVRRGVILALLQAEVVALEAVLGRLEAGGRS